MARRLRPFSSYFRGEHRGKIVLLKRSFLILSIVVVIALPILSQQLAGSKPSFEVASVKPGTAGDNRIMIMRQPGSRFTMNNATLKMVMAVAYSVRDFQIIGAPDWATSDRWNIEAKAEDGTVSSPKGFPDP